MKYRGKENFTYAALIRALAILLSNKQILNQQKKTLHNNTLNTLWGPVFYNPRKLYVRYIQSHLNKCFFFFYIISRLQITQNH